MIVSVKIEKGFEIEENTIQKTFRDWKLTEQDIEEFVCKNVSTIFGEEDSYLIVGRQVRDIENKRSDLLAVDGDGNLVLIEIKRDAADIKSRSEALEFQAIRYCASLATIDSPEKLVKQSFASYIEKYGPSYNGDLSSFERARKELYKFLLENNSIDNFNKKQRIVLIASEFDKSTLSACSWLIENGVDINVIKLQPIEISSKKYIEISIMLPTQNPSDFYVNLIDKKEKYTEDRIKIKRTNLPKMDKLFEWGIIKKGDYVLIKGHSNSRAQVIDYKNVQFNNTIMTFNEWGSLITGWPTIAIYRYTYIDGMIESLEDLRAKKIEELNIHRD